MNHGDLCVVRPYQGFSQDYFRNAPFLEDGKVTVLGRDPVKDRDIAGKILPSPEKYFENPKGSLWRSR
jgi:hypothetical protein